MNHNNKPKLELEPITEKVADRSSKENLNSTYQKPENQKKPAFIFPLTVNRKILSISQQIYIRQTHTEKLVGYAKQKLLKLVEEIEVFDQADKGKLLYTIKADRVLDFGAKYHFQSVEKGIIGYTKQHGLKSLWRTKFEVFDDTGTRFFIQQKNPITEMIETVLMMIPFVGPVFSMLSGYILNPVYEVTTIGGDVVAEMQVKPAFFEGKYEMRRLLPMNHDDQELVIMALLTVILMQAQDD